MQSSCNHHYSVIQDRDKLPVPKVWDYDCLSY